MGFSDNIKPAAPVSKKTSLLTEIATTKGLLSVAEGTAEGALFGYRGAPVGWSHDLERITKLPRRPLDPENDLRAAEAWTKHLRRDRNDVGPCDCDARWGVRGPDGKIVPGSGCLLSFNGVQGWCLEEASDYKTVWGNIGVGWGKTAISLFMAMAIPGIETVTILMPTQVKRQFVERDFAQWSAHFRTPHLAGHFTWPDRRPVVRVVTYHELQLPKNSDLLVRHGVSDLIIADEAHNLKDKKGTRWKRLKRAHEVAESQGKKMHFVCLTGTPTDKSIKEYAHLIGLALDTRSPLPLHHPTVDAWASAIDAGCLAPMGKLAVLCNPGESVQEGFARRISDTHSCIVTSSASIKCALSITAIKAPEVPPEITEHINGTRQGRRPDGEEAMDILTSARWARQLAAGFYSYWNFPRKEPDELIKEWLLKRKEYHKEAREQLKYSKEFVDSPLLLWNAAARWHDGYTHEGQSYGPRSLKGPMPVWASEHFLAWREIKDKVAPETRYRWVSDYLVDATVAWAKKNVGLIWVEHRDFGARVAEKAGIPFYDGGGKNPELDERGDRSVVLSVTANDTGKNLQRLWHKNLYPNPFSSNKRWEQSIGRTHRNGQPEDEVIVETFLHTPEMRRAFDTATSRARYVQTTGKNPQKLVYGKVDLSEACEDLEKPIDVVRHWAEEEW